MIIFQQLWNILKKLIKDIINKLIEKEPVIYEWLSKQVKLEIFFFNTNKKVKILRHSKYRLLFLIMYLNNVHKLVAIELETHLDSIEKKKV